MEATEYKVLSNRDMWSLISKLTSGVESARLWILDSWEVDHERPGLLSDKNLERLQIAIRRLPPKEREIHDAWNYAYRLMDYTLLETKINALEVCRDAYKALAESHRLDSQEAKALAGKVAKFRAETFILKALADKMGIRIEEELEPLRGELLKALLTLDQVDIENIKPDKAEMDYLQERLSMALGDTWMDEEGLNG